MTSASFSATLRTYIVAALIVSLTSGVLLEAQSGSGDPKPSIGSWSDVAKLAPGAELSIDLYGQACRSLVFLWADESALIVLNVAGQVLSHDVEQVLRELATSYPLQLKSGEDLVSGDVQIGRNGLFVGNRRIAAWEQIVNRFDRARVQEIRTIQRQGHRSVLKDVAIGAGIGGGVGLLIGALFFGCTRCDDPGLAGVFGLLGAGVGAAAGTAVGAARSVRPARAQGAIYSTR